MALPDARDGRGKEVGRLTVCPSAETALNNPKPSTTLTLQLGWQGRVMPVTHV
jgi:hypothetical protein